MRRVVQRLSAIYLDHQATTPCDPRVVEAMSPYWGDVFGNAASRTHSFGWEAAEAVEAARESVAALIGARARDLVFTSGATEANNLAILGAAREARERGAGDHVVTCRTEHRAVLDPCAALARAGFRITEVAVGADGRVDPARLAAAIEPQTTLVSIMHANNEIGVVQDIPSLAQIAAERGVLFHTDAAQSAGALPVDVEALGCDLLSMSAHKMYGPKGIGALFVRRRRPAIRLQPLVFGGGHEGGLRSGTLPVALCVGFGVAAEIARDRRDADAATAIALRERLLEHLERELPDVSVHGHRHERLPGNLNLSFGGVEAQALLLSVPELALSSGSACTSAKPEPSHVLRALGVPRARALGAIRIGLGRGTTEGDVDTAAALLVTQVRRLRNALRPARSPASRPRAPDARSPGGGSAGDAVAEASTPEDGTREGRG